jgi:hypothetical protein
MNIIPRFINWHTSALRIRDCRESATSEMDYLSLETSRPDTLAKEKIKKDTRSSLGAFRGGVALPFRVLIKFAKSFARISQSPFFIPYPVE